MSTVAEIAAHVAPITSPTFFFAGNATFTVAAPSGERYTFKAKKPKASDGAGAKPVFLSLLTGQNNETDYTYLGILDILGRVRLTKASKMQSDSKPIRVAQWAIAHVLAGLPLPAGYAIHHEGRCCRCGRTLTTPDSVAAGYGDECASKMGLA